MANLCEVFGVPEGPWMWEEVAGYFRLVAVQTRQPVLEAHTFEHPQLPAIVSHDPTQPAGPPWMLCPIQPDWPLAKVLAAIPLLLLAVGYTLDMLEQEIPKLTPPGVNETLAERLAAVGGVRAHALLRAAYEAAKGTA